MTCFEHYMYVVECADGSLYTGYAVDVESRVAAHNAGKGAKYTKPRLPVKLLARARFYSRPRAMSAEYHFKQLSRYDKDALLARAVHEPFEEVLCSAVPALSNEPVGEFVARALYDNVDLGYRDFTAKLIPNISKKTIVGVRTPVLRDIAKKILKRDDFQDFLDASPHAAFEEQQVHAFAIGYMKDYDQALCAVRQFLPSVDNWATCDQLGTKPLMKDPAKTLEAVREWIASSETYVARYGIGVLMQHYLDDLFQPEFLDLVAQRYTPDDYYLNMMRAWFFAECVAKQTDAVLPYLEGDVLDEWTRKKGIQKAIESRRVSPELKERLRKARKRS